MKGKFWIIKITQNIYDCLKSLKIHEDYIPRMLNNELDFFIDYEFSRNKYICLYYIYEDRSFHWDSFKFKKYLENNGGEINLRKEKLLKLNKLNETF